jgi:SSS family solute:Na+ symporter/sodium/pantothenate symporter
VSGLPFGPGALAFVALYLVAMVVVGLIARRAKRDDSLADFYLAGRNLGTFILFLTLYATQYSGNTMLGYPGEAYRLGFAWIMSVTFMMAIVIAYLPFAPRLRRLAGEHGFVTPGDFIDFRFGSPALSLVANLLLAVCVSNYLLAQLVAMGHVAAGLSGQLVPNWVGVLVLVLVIIVYETLGGLRAVAWTDTVQGVLLFGGLVALVYSIAPSPSDWLRLTEWLNQHAPATTAVPSSEVCRRWLGTVLLIGFSGAIYPQAIQRLYAARSTRTLKRSLQLMVFMPLVTVTVVVLIGLAGLQRFPGLEGVAADQVMPAFLREWSQQSTSSYVMAVLVVTGTLAAIMSTADSVILSLSSILSKDILGKTVLSGASERRLTFTGKALSWLLMGVLAIVAVSPNTTLWGLIEFKMELLIQISPLFILGVTWPRFQTRPALLGLVLGAATAVGLMLAGIDDLAGLPAGIVAWALNLAVAIGLSLAMAPSPVPMRQPVASP